MPDIPLLTTELIWRWLPAVLVAAGSIVALSLVNYALTRRRRALEANPWRRQLVVLVASAAAMVAFVLALPIADSVRGQLLSLLGLLISATIALASTSLVGNAMAGLMLRSLRNFSAGDFVEVNDHFGRVSKRGLFHVELQTPDRDIISLPNLYLATNPVKTVLSSGTVVSASVSLGYEVPHARAEERLLSAARSAGLAEAFVQIVELRDFAVTYRAAGFLEDPRGLLDVRSNLRACMLDKLHGAGIEIVSPTFMVQRPMGGDETVIPEAAPPLPRSEKSLPDQIVFDRAEAAASREELQREYAGIEDALVQAREGVKNGADPAEVVRLEKRRAWLEKVLSEDPEATAR